MAARPCSGGVSWLEEECRERSDTKWMTLVRLACSASTWVCRLEQVLVRSATVLGVRLCAEEAEVGKGPTCPGRWSCWNCLSRAPLPSRHLGVQGEGREK